MEALRNAVSSGRVEWMKHSLERMLERGVLKETVKEVLLKGEAIEDYPDAKPYPSALFFGWADNAPFHVVAAYDSMSGYCLVITSYKPDLEYFESDFKTRRKHG